MLRPSSPAKRRPLPAHVSLEEARHNDRRRSCSKRLTLISLSPLRALTKLKLTPDALLFLEDLEPEPIEDNPLCADSRVLEKSIDYSTCGSNTSDDSDGCCSHDTVGCWAFDRTLSGPLTPSAGEINAAASVELCNTPPPPSTTDAAAVSKDLGDGVKVLASPMDSYRRNTPGELIRGEDLLADIDASSAATGLHRQAAATDVAPAGTNSCPLAIEAEGIAAENSLPGSDGSSGSSSGGESEESGHVDGEGNVRASAISAGVVVDPAPAASTPTARAGAAVPTRLLDAIDLWESANAHSIAKKKAAAIAAAAAAREHARSTRAERSSNTGSTAKNKSKKKKNEFGKRRRSSGGGDQGAPLLETPRTGVAGASAGKAKGKGNGRGKGKEKGKKVDPLVRIRDARQLSRKPLIVQWLKSDGCDSDEEAEAALGKAVGSLSAISRYWGGGG